MEKTASTETLTHKIVTGLGIGLLIALVFCFLQIAGAFESPDLMIFDAMQRATSDPAEADDDILLLTIDQASIEKVEQVLGHRYPWPRALQALMLGFIQEGRPRAVLFDLFFEGTSPGGEELDGVEMDLEFASAIRRSGSVVLGVKIRPSDSTPVSSDSATLLGQMALPGEPWTGLTRFGRIDPLAAPLISSGARFGFVNATPEADGVIRRATLLAMVDGRMVPSIALAALQAGADVSFGSERGDLRVGVSRVPVSADGRAWIRYHGPGGIEAGQGRTYRYIPIANVIFSAIRAQQGSEPILDPATFRNKWVVIGSTAAAGFDLKATPFSKEGTFPGMEIQATVLDNLLHDGFLWRIPVWLVILMVVTGCVLVGILGQVLKSLLWGGLLLLTAICGYALASMVAFRAGVLVDVVAVEAGLFVTAAMMTYANFLRERRSKQRIRSMFQYYLDPSVVDRIIDNPDRLGLGGELRVCTVFFSDIVGFTSISEKLTPEQIVEIMNRYLGEMTGIIIHNGGLLEKYIGDAVMAVFGAPADLPDHPRAACRAALESHRRLAELSDEFAGMGLPRLQCGVGINTGAMVVGNIGSATRGNYTVMGDAVNLASRIEGLTREFGCQTVIGPETRAGLDDSMLVRELDFIRVKGKQEPVRIFELIGEHDRGDPKTSLLLDQFSSGLAAYRSGKWEEAQKRFGEILEKFPDDGPSRTYLERCAAYRANPPQGAWDGVFIMTRK
jgi:adenylate cyclase